MDGFYKKYASAIVYDFLKLQQGDALSVNSEEADFEFARFVANEAIKVTHSQVKVILTENGKPVDVAEFEPDGMPVKTEGFAMLRIQGNRKKREPDGETLDVIVEPDNFAALQKLGHLAEPVLLNRRISVPFCVAPLFDEESEGFRMLSAKIENGLGDKILAADYRKNFLNHSDIDRLHFTGAGIDFTVEVPHGTVFTGGTSFLPSGRSFVSGPDFDILRCSTDRHSLNGVLTVQAVVMGKKQSLTLEYENGKLVEHSESVQFERYRLLGDGAAEAGYLSLGDRCFSLHLGGSLLEFLVSQPENEVNIPEFFNTSPYTLECELDSKLNITCSGCDGKEHELVRKGFFLD
ncbi:MAG: aminopeptidase [Sphaerochaetaceae bacterium]|nr:aminopeptidase [Sphaerochaetaceae bacterium]